VTPAESRRIDALEMQLAGLMRQVGNTRGLGVNTTNGATHYRTTQLGFAAELTAAWDAADGYAWKRLRLEALSLNNPTIQPEGVGAVTPDGNEDLEVGTRGWMEPSPDAQGFVFVAGGSGSSTASSCPPPGLDESECVRFTVSAGLDRCADIAAATIAAALSGGWWVAAETITTAAGAGTLKYRIGSTGYPEAKITVGITDYYGTPAGCDADSRPVFRFGGAVLCDGTPSTETCDNGFSVAVGCVPCGYDECTGWYCDDDTGVHYYAANCAAYDLLVAVLGGGGDPVVHPPCADAPERIRVDLSSDVACVGARSAEVDNSAALPAHTYTHPLGYTDCGLDAGFVLTCDLSGPGTGWQMSYDANAYTLVAASTTPFVLVFQYTGAFSGGNGSGTATVTITAA
jgi:hypothetical protein